MDTNREKAETSSIWMFTSNYVNIKIIIIMISTAKIIFNLIKKYLKNLRDSRLVDSKNMVYQLSLNMYGINREQSIGP